MILEGIVTTLSDDGEINVAPMGPVVDQSMTELLLRPFKTSQTYRNLKRHPFGVFHVVDDVLLLAEAAVNRLSSPPETVPAEKIEGAVLQSACRWYEFRIEEFEDRQDRTKLLARVLHRGRIRDFFGFNRAKHAVLEAAILATRLHLLPEDDIRRQFAELKVPVDKTAGPQETEAFRLLERYVDDWYAERR